MKIKCSYESCYQHFDSHDAMIKHKKKDPEHAYCRKCDIDCSDDMQLMIHQIESPKHSKLLGRIYFCQSLTTYSVCCPVCGMEVRLLPHHGIDYRLILLQFKSAGGRDRHVEVVGCFLLGSSSSILIRPSIMHPINVFPVEVARLSSLAPQHSCATSSPTSAKSSL